MLLNKTNAFAPVTEKAYAKLNISLDVTARRDDGYHDMLMVMQTVSLCDELSITPEPGERVWAVTSLPYVPGDARNLAVRAALKFLELADDQGRGMKITLRKHIPVGAGMAGGSADAAAVLRALNRAYGFSPRASPWARTWPSVCGAGPHWPQAGEKSSRRCPRCRPAAS